MRRVEPRPDDVDPPAISRREFVRIGGLVVAATVAVACTDDDAGEVVDERPRTARTDLVVLRTASSLEALTLTVYQRALDSGTLTPPVGDTFRLFLRQHREHAELFRTTTQDLGGAPFTEPNPALLQDLQPTLDGLASEGAALQLVLDLETMAAQTYQAAVGTFRDRTLNVGIMTVGGVEARHAAVLARALGADPIPAAVQSTDDAVEAGTGV
jgi:Ferritin-like domain